MEVTQNITINQLQPGHSKMNLNNKDVSSSECTQCKLFYLRCQIRSRCIEDEKAHKGFHKTHTRGLPFKVEEVAKMMEIDLGTGWIIHQHCKTQNDLVAYDRYLECASASYNSGEASTMGNVGMSRPIVSTMPGHSLAGPSVMRRPGSGGHDLAPKG
ncbi:hypothetical protein K1719_039055 [Acacia pycnantha]|nr:hypothetical protein K1719_039055 [Acacia pycnantha]